MRGDVQIINPSNRWFKWSGSTGSLSYYDKVAKENVEVQTPFTFLLLETYSTIKGYDEDAKEGIYANEVKDTKKEILNVRCGKQSIAIGTYENIKETVIARGGGYCQSCYVAYRDESGKLAIGNISMSGSSFGGGTHKPADKNMKDIEIGGWLQFAKANAATIMSKAVVIEGKDERICTQGSVKFYVPKFKLIEVSPETDKEAIALTHILKAYMTEYFKKSATEESHTEEPTIEQAVNAAHASTFGGTPAELTEQEKAFLVKPEIDNSQPAQELGELPNDFFVDDDSNLPF